MRHFSAIDLAILTLLHLLTDGVCGAVLGAFAVQEPQYETIVFWFTVYTVLAFGLQGPAGWIIDCFPKSARSGLLLAAGLLFVGGLLGLPLGGRVAAIGLGNCLFHVAGGRIVLTNTGGYERPGLFVAGGAVGLGLGLYGFVGAGFFGTADLLLTLFLLSRPPADDGREEQPAPLAAGTGKLIFCSGLLMGCIVLRGFGGNTGSAGLPLLTLPIVMAAGKWLGGAVADRFGYRRAVLVIFLLGFVALQFSGVVFWLAFILAGNMTMPLTLRLLHRCRPQNPGLMFGLAAGCLVPGVILSGWLELPSGFMLSLQFVILAFCACLTEKKEAGYADT